MGRCDCANPSPCLTLTLTLTADAGPDDDDADDNADSQQAQQQQQQAQAQQAQAQQQQAQAQCSSSWSCCSNNSSQLLQSLSESVEAAGGRQCPGGFAIDRRILMNVCMSDLDSLWESMPRGHSLDLIYKVLSSI